MTESPLDSSLIKAHSYIRSGFGAENGETNIDCAARLKLLRANWSSEWMRCRRQGKVNIKKKTSGEVMEGKMKMIP